MKRGAVRAGENNKRKGYERSFTLAKPSRNKTKRGAQADGYKSRAECRKKAGYKKAGRGGGGGRPEIQDAKQLWNEAQGSLRQAETTAPVVAQPRGWGGDAQLGDSQGWGPPKRRLRSSAVRVPRSPSAVFILCGSGGARPLPTPRSSASLPLAQATSYICKYGGVGPAPLPLLRDLAVSPLPPPQVLDWDRMGGRDRGRVRAE